jgi:hypothetical protein
VRSGRRREDVTVGELIYDPRPSVRSGGCGAVAPCALLDLCGRWAVRERELEEGSASLRARAGAVPRVGCRQVEGEEGA